MSTSYFAVAIFSIAFAASSASAQITPDDRRAELLRQRAAIDAELRALDADQVLPPSTVAKAAPRPSKPEAMTETADIIVTGKARNPTL